MTEAVVARGLGRVYGAGGRVAALTDLTLTIPPGRIYGLIGRNGAGKTTFVRIAATQLAPTSGSLEVLGYDVMREAGAIRERIACIPQESRPLYFLTVDELVFLYLRMRGLETADARRRSDDVLEELDLASVRHRLVSRLSGGQRRRAMVAMVLASDAELLFLDEPTTGLDPLARREVWRALQRAQREKRTVVLTTHYLDEAEALSARLALLEGGRLVVEGTPEDLRARVRRPFRVRVEGGMTRAELEPYGEVAAVDGGFLVFGGERSSRELAQAALGRGLRVSMGPVSLEDIFLQLVGRSIEEDSVPAEEP
ncbi:MAG TPA: ABC transporter ATP-binding protein [Thermoplasmata archaeon]|nr:ABC transporter ATP-binding protein [Thermoplasmata archaeon]